MSKLDDTLDALRQENSKLRGRILEQAHELAKLQALLDIGNRLGRTKAKLRVRQVLQARVQANLSLINNADSRITSTSHTSRPQSAPITSSEIRTVCLHALAKDHNNITQQ